MQNKNITYGNVIDTFSRLLVHEIRNPLALLKGNLQLIESKEPKIKEIDRWGNLHNNIDQINTTLEYFSNISKLFTIEEEDVDISLIVTEIFDSFQCVAKEKNIDFNLYIDQDNLTHIKGDGKKIRHALSNLVKNAFEACEPYDSVSLRCDSIDDESVEIKVIDTGSGIDKKIINSILTPFVTYKQNGTGLGLTLVNYIANEHNGKLKIESELGEGSTFTICLPKA